MNHSLLPLFAALPLAVAGLTAFLRFKFLDRLMMLAIPLGTIIGGVLLMIQHHTEPVVAHSVGNFVDGVAIVFVSDTMAALLLIVTGFVTLMSSVYLMLTGEDRYRFAAPLIIMVTAGVNGALLTGDLFNFFVFIEVMLLPSYALLAITGTWRRLGVGRMFLLINLVASITLMIGVGLVYGATGTVNLAALADQGMDDPRAGLAIGVVMLAMLAKAGAVPVHSWLPRAYPATSAGIMSLFSALHTKIGVYALFRIYTTVFAPGSALAEILLVIVIVTIVVGSLATFAERRIRGALAFQMVAGVGQILVALVIFTKLSLAAGLFYMVHHMVTMAILIMCAGAIESTYGSGRFERVHGLMRREPVLAAVMALGFFSLVGLPPTSGLWGKVFLLKGSTTADHPVAIAIVTAIVLASILSMMALQNVWRRVFFGPPMKEFLPEDPVTARGERTPVTEATRIPKSLLIPPMVLVGVSVAMFVAIGALFPLFEAAADGLMDTSAYVKAVLGR